MKTNIIVMSVLVAALFVSACYFKGPSGAGRGVRNGVFILGKIWPLLLLALVAVGLIQVLIPPEAISRYLGTDRPFRAVIIAWLVGAVIPGAPYVTLPIAASLLSRGAGIGAAATLVMSASLVGLSRIPYEVAFVGWQFSVLRVAACALVAPVVGSIIHLLNRVLHLFPLE